MTTTAQPPPATTTDHPPSGLRVLVVGTGFAGLTAAIECHRHGHAVTVLEKFPERKELGDIISFGQNASRIFQRWPGVAAQLEALSLQSKGLEFRTCDGDVLLRQTWADELRAWGPRYNGHRGAFHRVVLEHAVQACGIDVRLGHRVVEYGETAEGAFVVAEVAAEDEDEDGQRVTLSADVVLAADGVRSLGRTLVLGHADRPLPSGYAVYRAWFDGAALAADPVTAFFFGHAPGDDQHVCWLGPDVHFIAAALQQQGSFSWVCTHRDTADIDERWQLAAPVADARAAVAGWADPVVARILAHTPEPLVDWKLVYRDPLPAWVSPRRRIALLGDAAHPFLPTSIQGASQAMEDGATLAVALRRAGASARVPEAVAAFEALRYERVRAAQKTGETTRDTWHRTDLAHARAHPESIRLPREAWLLAHDAEAYAEAHYDATVAVLRQSPGLDTAAARRLHVPTM